MERLLESEYDLVELINVNITSSRSELTLNDFILENFNHLGEVCNFIENFDGGNFLQLNPEFEDDLTSRFILSTFTQFLKAVRDKLLDYIKETNQPYHMEYEHIICDEKVPLIESYFMEE